MYSPLGRHTPEQITTLGGGARQPGQDPLHPHTLLSLDLSSSQISPRHQNRAKHFQTTTRNHPRVITLTSFSLSLS